MKNLLFLALLTSAQAFAHIQELKSYQELDLRDLQDTLVVFDIDNTLLRQDSMIGTHQWGDDMRDYAISQGADPKQAADWQLRIFAEVQEKVKVVPTERKVLEILRQLKQRGIPHFALTARPSYLKARTLKQLEILGHDFGASFPAQHDMAPLKEYYQSGVIFSGLRPKGELMQLIASQAIRPPKRIVFIDDRRSNLDSVEASLQGSGIDLLGLRYGGVDGVVKSYDRALADLEYSFLRETRELLSDREARALVGHPDLMVARRFEAYTAPGTQLEPIGTCVQVRPMSYSCPYRYDGEEFGTLLEFKIAAGRGTLYFGKIFDVKN